MEIHQKFVVASTREGGIGQRETVRLLKERGFKAKASYSPFVGTSAVVVIGTEEQIGKATKFLESRDDILGG